MKKSISILMVLCMLFTMVTIAPWAADAEETAVSSTGITDISGTNYEQAVKVLNSLGVVEGYTDGSYDPNGNITRAEFTALVARMLRGGSATNDNSGAVDNDKISESPENAAAVEAAKNAGTLPTGTGTDTSTDSTSSGAKVTYNLDQESKIRFDKGSGAISTSNDFQPPAVWEWSGNGELGFQIVGAKLNLSSYDTVTYVYGSDPAFKHDAEDLFIYVDGDYEKRTGAVVPTAADGWTSPATVKGKISMSGVHEIYVGFINNGHSVRLESVTFSNSKSAAAATINFAEGEAFSDVASDHWAAKDIAFAKGLGIVSGFGDSTFRPDDQVTYEQAVKMVVSAAGYGFMAEVQGGYPMGYIAIASKNKMLTKVNGMMGTPATRGQVAQMLYNILTIDYLTVQNISGTEIQYVGGKTILGEVFDAQKIEGKVTANSDTGIEAAETDLNVGEIEIDGAVYVTADVDSLGYLGYTVDAYVKPSENKGGKGTLYIAIPDNDVKTVDIKNDDIKKITTLAGGSIELEVYLEDGKKAKYTIAGDANTIYNGKPLGKNITKDTLEFEYGSIKLISTDGTKNYDLVYISDYVPMYVTAAKTSSKVLEGIVSVDAAGNEIKKSVNLNDDNDRVIVKYMKNGYEAAFTDIKAETVVYIYQNGKYYTIELADAVTTGEIAQTTIDTVTIDGTEYDRADNVFNKFALGDNVKAYTTTEGMIFYAKKAKASTSGINYGLLMKAGTETGLVFEENDLKFKIMDTSGKIVYYDAADNMKFNEFTLGRETGGLKTTATVIINKLKDSATIGGLFSAARPTEQIIKYRVSGTTITEMKTAILKTDVTDEDDFTVSTDMRRGNVAGPSLNNGIIENTGYKIGNAKAFRVPETNEATVDDKDYSVGTLGTGARGAHPYGFVLYDLNAVNEAACVVLWNENKKSNGTDYNNSVVASVFDHADAAIATKDGVEVQGYKVFYYEGTKLNNIFMEKADYIAMNPQKGDIYMRRVFNGTGFLASNVEQRQNMSSIKNRIATNNLDRVAFAGNTSYGNIELEMFFGKVVSVKGKEVCASIGATLAQQRTVTVPSVLIYDFEEDEFTVGTVGDISEGDYVFFQTQDRNFKMMVVYHNIDAM